jgi:hypothetical protein
MLTTPSAEALETFYAEVKSGDWVCPNGCIPGGYFGPWGPGCGTCGWGWNADASRLSHTPTGSPCCVWDGLPVMAEPHCGWRDVLPGESLTVAANTAISESGVKTHD